MMRVSAGIVRYPDGRILICRRGEGRKNAHLWEFPGGKQEAGESPEDALRRELLEELSLPIADVSPLCRREAQGIAFDFLTATATRAPVLTEHEGYALVHPAEMTKYVFCPADEVVARQIAFANVRACLWDFDGTLMDTYPLLTEVFVRIAAENGVRLTAENALSLLKGTLRDACAALSALTDVSLDELLKECRAAEAERLLDAPKLLCGIPELLLALHERGVRHYVVTHRDLRCRDMLAQCGVLPLISGFLTHEDGYPRKPAPDSLLWEQAGGSEQLVNGRTAFDAMRRGDASAKAVVDGYVHYLCVGITSIVNIFQPEVLCVGGGISREGEAVMAPVRAYVGKYGYARGSAKQPRIVAASLAGDAGIIGAALLGTEKK